MRFRLPWSASEEKTNDVVEQCMGMAKRIDSMRMKLKDTLEKLGSSRDWSHITKQIGMFAYSGMSKDEVVALREKHHIYCTLDGRISMAVSWLPCFVPFHVDHFNLSSEVSVF